MTVKEISELCNVSGDTVKRKIKELFPNKMQNGKTTRLSRDEAIKVVELIRKKGFVQPTQNARLPTQNAQANTTQIIKEVMQEMVPLFSEILARNNELLLKKIETNNIKQLDFTDQLTVKEFLIDNNIKCFNNSQYLRKIDRICTKVSRELKRSISFKQEGRYSAGCYDIDIIRHSVEIINLEMQKEKFWFDCN